ncbi:MAG: hypothetical protein FWE12_08535 [Oscillospiraceae bacterium]|nr:hypothetical protein [Oscillospiraceae bacterium]
MFSVKLYKEALRRSLPLAALFIAILMLGAVLIPISAIQAQMRAMANGWNWGAIVVDGMGQNIALTFAMPFFAPFMTLFLFSFLNKRNSSDFYHAIPHKREVLFGSFAAATLTWVIGGIWVAAGTTLAIYSFAPEGVAIINYSSVLLTTLGITVGCLLVIAATLMAMSVTGTAFSNIVVALLILFLPRTLLTSFTTIVMSLTRVIPMDSFGIFGDYTYNIPFSFLMSFGIWGEYAQVGSIVYTGVLALIYFGFALVLFKRRGSEVAQSAALNSYLQLVVRVSLAFVVCLPAIMAFFALGQFTSGDFIAIFGLYCVAVLVYFGYELISTRKFGNLKKALPGLIVLLVLNVAFIVGATTVSNVVLNREIPAAQVQAVRIHENAGWGSGWWGGWRTYEEIRVGEMSIQDERLTALLLDALALNIAFNRNEVPGHLRWSSNHAVFFETTSGRTIRRNIMVTEDVDRQLAELLNNHRDYAEAFLHLPESPAEVFNHQLSSEAAWEVYAALREEVRGLSLPEWRAVYGGGHGMTISVGGGGFIHYGELHVRGFIGNETFANRYPITSVTPRAAELFLRHVNAGAFQDTERVLAHLLEGELQSHWSTVSYLGPSDDHFWFNFEELRGDEREAIILVLLDAIQAQGMGPIDLSRSHFSINIDGWLEDPRGWEWGGGEWINVQFFFHADLEEVAEAAGRAIGSADSWATGGGMAIRVG